MSDTAVIDQWHQLIKRRDPSGLDELLAEDVVFYSPVVFSPQAGRPITRMYLAAAFQVFVNETFTYVRQVIGASDAVLEFEVQIDGVEVNGVDIIKWNASQQITEFKVMLRPLKAVHLIHQKMAEILQQRSSGAESPSPRGG